MPGFQCCGQFAGVVHVYVTVNNVVGVEEDHQFI